MPNLHVYPKYWQLGLAAGVAWLLVGYLGLTGQFEEKVDGVIVAFRETDRNGNRRPGGQEGDKQRALERVCEKIARENGSTEQDLEGSYYWYCRDPETGEEVSYQKVAAGAEVRGCLIYRFAKGTCTFEREVQ